MKKIRTQSKQYTLKSQDYKSFRDILIDARNRATNNKVFWDCQDEQELKLSKKAFLHVAQREGFLLKVTRVKGACTLKLTFQVQEYSPIPSFEQAMEKVLSALAKSEQPMGRKELIEQTQIPEKYWNELISTLVAEEKVTRIGKLKMTRYLLKKA